MAENNLDLHGIEFKSIDEAGKDITLASSGAIALFATSLKGEVKKWYEISNLESAKEIFGGASKKQENLMFQSIDAILKQSACKIMCCRLEDTGATQDVFDIISSCPETPDVIIAPKESMKKDIASKMASIALQIGAIAIIDSDPEDINKAITYSNDLDVKNTYITFSELDFGFGFIPASAGVAGLIKKVESESGYWKTPSNKRINGVINIKKYVSWSISDKLCEANKLNKNNINPFVKTDEGIRLWGNRLSDGSFISTLKIKNIVEKSIRRNMLWAIDEDIDPAYITLVTRRINNFFKDMQIDGAILGGSCFISAEQNSVAKLKTGKTTFDYEFTEKLPAEHLIFRGKLTYDRYNNIFEQQ